MDYKKMESGDFNVETEFGGEFSGGHHVMAREDEDISSVHDDTSADEAEIVAMEERLKEKLKLKKKLEKKDKLRRLSAEVERASKKMNELKGGKKSSKKVNISSLRGMEDVSKQVDKLMDQKVGQFGVHSKSKSKKGKNKKKYLTSSSSSSSSCSSTECSASSCSDSSSSEQSSDEDRKKRHSRRRKVKNSKKVNKRSGKSSKLTSRVKYPQEWPHTHLSLHFVSKNKGYEDLSIEEFCAGYASILESTKSKKQFKSRLSHLKELMYLATKYRWDCILNYLSRSSSSGD